MVLVEAFYFKNLGIAKKRRQRETKEKEKESQRWLDCLNRT